MEIGLGFSIFSIQSYALFNAVENIFLNTFISLICFLIIVSFSLFVRLKETVFLYYTFFIASNLLYFSVFIGLFYPLFNIDTVSFMHYTVPFSMITISFVLYCKSFLTINEKKVKGLSFIYLFDCVA